MLLNCTYLLLAATLAAADAPFDVTALDGQSAAGPLVALDGEQVALETPEGRKTFALSALGVLTHTAVDLSDDRKAALWVELIDQSGLAGTAFTVSGKTAKVQLAGGTSLEVPTRAIRWVRFTAPVARDVKLAKQWSDITELKANGDVLVIRKNGALDYLEGIQGDVDDTFCKFEVDKEVVKANRLKVEGIVYFHPNTPQLPEPIGQARTADGSLLAVRSAVLENDMINMDTPTGIEIKLPLERLAKLDFSSGKIVYLSDLEPESAVFQPLVGFKDDLSELREFFHYRRDLGFDRNPLRLAGKTYRKGLALHSKTVLSYKLPGKFRSFKAVLGIDETTRETGNLRVEIKGDGKTLWQAELRGNQEPQQLDLEISGVKRLEIVADYGEQLDLGDRLELCDARVTK